MTATDRCPGCGVRVERVDAPTPSRLGVAPGCWAVFLDLLAQEYGPLGLPECHRLSVDVFGAQHPGDGHPLSARTLAGHLLGLCLVLERGWRPAEVEDAVRGHLVAAADPVALAPPDGRGLLTVHDVCCHDDAGAHDAAVREWAARVWDAWTPQHDTVRRWADQVESRATSPSR